MFLYRESERTHCATVILRILLRHTEEKRFSFVFIFYLFISFFFKYVSNLIYQCNLPSAALLLYSRCYYHLLLLFIMIIK